MAMSATPEPLVGDEVARPRWRRQFVKTLRGLRHSGWLLQSLYYALRVVVELDRLS
jgi:hypothetical protein